MAFERSFAEQKYDRQMRLWGSHGQLNLETAHICCLGSGATASESLKNLVLPNVGRFTIVDDAITSAADKNNNFFVDIHSIGRPRAEVVKELLLEMNSEVKGESVVKNIRELLSGDLSFFAQFSLILVSDPSLPVVSVLPLASFLWKANIPLVLVQAKGLLGSVRLQIREHHIVESHPGNDRYDLYVHPRQMERWPELQAYVKQFKVFRSDFEQPAAAASSADSSSAAASAAVPDGEEHAHIPYVAILSSCISRWALDHSGSLPSTYEEKKAFKAFLRASAWTGEESNFDEAIDFAHRAYELPSFDRHVQAIFADPSARDEATLRQSKFWLLVRAVDEFVKNEGGGICAPVSQNLPDMHCKTAYYVQLKQIFQRKAEQDLAAVQSHLTRLLSSLGLPADHVSPREVDHFVRNIRTIRLIRTRSLEQEFGSDGSSSAERNAQFQAGELRDILEEAGYAAEEEAQQAQAEAAAAETDGSSGGAEVMPQLRKIRKPHNIHWYLALRAADVFLARTGRTAGASGPDGAAVTPAQLDSDVRSLQAIESELLTNTTLIDVVPTPDVAVLSEVVRSGASEPHVTAAFLGGLASQLALKLILKQFVPLNNTVFWNGLFATSTTLAL